MGGRTRREGSVREKILRFYEVEENSRGIFLLQVDWMLENAVFPMENEYAVNLMDLWDVYMPNYKFDEIVLKYSKKYFPVLRYVHDREIYKFNSVRLMQENAIKNFVKFCMAQGETDRAVLTRECFDKFKDVSDRTLLHDMIKRATELYFQNGEIEQYGLMFLKRFQDYTEQPYTEILERLTDIHEQKELMLSARADLYYMLKPVRMGEEKFQTLVNILLCRIAATDGERRFSDVLESVWNNTLEGVPYDKAVYAFIEKYEKPYMNAACFGIKNIRDIKVIRQLYKDAIIFCAVTEAVEKGHSYGVREIKDYWKRDGMRFSDGFFFDDEFERIKRGLDPKLLLAHKADIERFHAMVLERTRAVDFAAEGSGGAPRGRSAASETEQAALNKKERQIEELQERIAELEEKVDNTEKEVLSQFISLLDSKKYDHVLGKLYRIAYDEETGKMEDVQRSLKNLFEIMNISGIDVYGEIGAAVDAEEIKRGRYRVEKEISERALVKYPGYRVGNSVILHPLAEEG